jgi:hypothetical protein
LGNERSVILLCILRGNMRRGLDYHLSEKEDPKKEDLNSGMKQGDYKHRLLPTR